MSKIIEIELPFAGFYETFYDDSIDRAIESSFDYDHETGMDKDLPDNFWDISMDVVEYRPIFNEIAKEYARIFGEEYGLDLTFKDMTSPREYNFSTDRIFCDVSAEQFNAKIRVMVENHPDWPEYIKEKYTSYDGFWSFFENDYKHEQWTRDDLEPVQYLSMLEFWLLNIEHEGTDQNLYGLEWDLVADKIEFYELDSVIAATNAIEAKLKETANA